jgi:hypothetical protein
MWWRDRHKIAPSRLYRSKNPVNVVDGRQILSNRSIKKLVNLSRADKHHFLHTSSPRRDREKPCSHGAIGAGSVRDIGKLGV